MGNSASASTSCITAICPPDEFRVTNLKLRLGKKKTQEVFQFKTRRLRSKGIIGEGGYAFVHKVKDPKTKEYFAVKKLLIQDEEQMKLALHEVEVHMAFDHPNILKVYEYVVIDRSNQGQNSEVLLLMPYYKKGNMQHMLQRYETEKRRMPEIQCLNIFLQICEAVKRFHERGWAHNDIKPLNILLSDDGVTPILLDFGSVSTARHNIETTAQARKIQEIAEKFTSAPYRAPELFEVPTPGFIDERTDVWALGCTLFCFAYYRSPFESHYEQGGSLKLAAINGRFTFPEVYVNEDRSKPFYSNEFKDLIRSMLRTDIASRPTIHQVIESVERLLDSKNSLVNSPRASLNNNNNNRRSSSSTRQ